MIIKRVKSGIFDVFFDYTDEKGKIIPSGWENWCRFQLISEKGKRTMTKIAGKSVPNGIMFHLRKKFER